MKIHQEENYVQRSANVGEEQQFTIKSTEMAFEILSAGLYGNKIRAIIRELACNAHDAHIASGQPNLPIDIQLPTIYEPTFSITDHGHGLSHEQMVGYWQDITNADGSPGREWVGGIYNTYFESTKQASDDFIGQFGLGSKSPFSYASAFNVESRQDGIARVYSCYKNDQRKPAISLMGQMPTDKGSGMTITMSVKREDIDKFRQEAKIALIYFSPKPNVTGPYDFKPFTLEHTVKGSNWRVRKTEYGTPMAGPYVIQGFVSYPVDVQQLIQNGLTEAAVQVAATNIDLYVPIGQVTSAASRENLHYDPRTIRNLIEALKSATAEMRQSFQIQFDECKTQYEAAITHDKLLYGGTESLRKLYETLHKAEKFTWKGIKVDTAVNVDLSNIKTVSIYRYGKMTKGKKMQLQGKWEPRIDSDIMEIGFRWNTKFIIDDRPQGSTERLRQWLLSQPKDENRDAQLFVIRPMTKNLIGNIQPDVDVISKEIGVAFEDISVIPPIVRSYSGRSYSAGSGNRKSAATCFVWQGFTTRVRKWGRKEVNTTFSRRVWSLETIDFSTGGLYIPITGYAPDKHVYQFNDFINDAVALGIILNPRVVAFTEAELKRAKKEGVWTSIFDHVDKIFKQNYDSGMYTARQALTNLQQRTSVQLVELVRLRANLVPNLPQGLFKRFADEVVKLTAGVNYPQESINRMARAYISSANTKANAVPVEDITEQQLFDRYPLLKLYQERFETAMFDYVGLFDQYRSSPPVEVQDDDDIPF